MMAFAFYRDLGKRIQKFVHVKPRLAYEGMDLGLKNW
jgi:hypothetical protein